MWVWVSVCGVVWRYGEEMEGYGQKVPVKGASESRWAAVPGNRHVINAENSFSSLRFFSFFG